MEIKAFICPQCGASLDVNQSTAFAFCPHCGSRLHISYEDEKSSKPGFRDFVTAEGLPVAKAILPDDYTLEGVIHQEWQSELVPLMSYIRAASPANDIILSSASKELFYDVRTASMKSILSLIQTHTKAGYVPFMNEEAYIMRWAEQMAGTKLTPVASTKLPSVFGNNPELAKAHLKNDISLYDMYMGVNASVMNEGCSQILYKFEGKIKEQDIIALVGADYEKADLTYSMIPGMDQISDLAGRAFSGLKDAFGGVSSKVDAGKGSLLSDFKDTFNQAVHGDENGQGKMTFNDWMHGGLVGKMMRDKKAAGRTIQSASAPQSSINRTDENSSVSNERHGSMTMYGSQRRYMCIALKTKEEEATEIFLHFIGSITPDSSLVQKEQELVQQKINMVLREAANNQAMAQQMQMQTRQLQMQTSQMISRNSQQVSAGIMDSWNKRQAAQSRMSANYSEAVRGVNSYTTSTGRTVEMGVGADHVYQNKYGDTIGISGNDIDTETASKLDWVKLNKK